MMINTKACLKIAALLPENGQQHSNGPFISGLFPVHTANADWQTSQL